MLNNLEDFEKAEIKSRILDKVQILDNDCWQFTGTKTELGYGMMMIRSVSNSPLGVHRVMYELEVGPVPDDRDVLHYCFTSSCCNPDHLFLGTDYDRISWYITNGKTTSQPGEKHGLSKLTESDVKEIRSSGLTYRALAQKFNVHRNTIRFIRSKISWKHVP